MLLERHPMSAADAVEYLVGIQAQEPQAPYLGLWSRLESFDPEELSELIAGGAAVRGVLMRGTLHLVTARDWSRLQPLLRGVGARAFDGSPFSKAIADVDRNQLLTLGRRLLSEKPRTRAELGRLLAERWTDSDPVSLAHAVAYLEPIVQVPPRGLWRQSGQARWMPLDPGKPLPVEELVRRYLAAFGPAAVQDIRAWSGLTGLRDVVERMDLMRFIDEAGRELLDVADAPLPDPDTPAPPRFLPPFDNAILAHDDRSRIIAAGDRPALFQDRLMRAFLIDGFVAGTWRLDGIALRVQPFRPLDPGDESVLRQEAERLLGLLLPDGSTSEVRISLP